MNGEINISFAPFMGQEPTGHIVYQDGIPAGFSLLPDGIYPQVAPKDPQRICSPLRVSALFCDATGKNWGRLVEVQDRHGNWHAFPVFDRMLSKSASSVLASLQGLGLRLPRVKGRHGDQGHDFRCDEGQRSRLRA